MKKFNSELMKISMMICWIALKLFIRMNQLLTVAKGMKLLANALLKSKAVSKDINTFFDNNDFIKTTMYLTGKQRADIERAANRHGWTLSRECRYRIQTTLENELDFFDQELLMMNRCRNSIDKIGRNFHYIIVNDQTRGS